MGMDKREWINFLSNCGLSEDNWKVCACQSATCLPHGEDGSWQGRVSSCHSTHKPEQWYPSRSFCYLSRSFYLWWFFFFNVLALAGLRWKISDSYQSKGLACSFRVCLISSSDILRLSLGFIFFECCFHVKSWICVCEIPCWMLEVQPLYL